MPVVTIRESEVLRWKEVHPKSVIRQELKNAVLKISTWVRYARSISIWGKIKHAPCMKKPLKEIDVKLAFGFCSEILFKSTNIFIALPPLRPAGLEQSFFFKASYFLHKNLIHRHSEKLIVMGWKQTGTLSGKALP